MSMCKEMIPYCITIAVILKKKTKQIVHGSIIKDFFSLTSFFFMFSDIFFDILLLESAPVISLEWL